MLICQHYFIFFDANAKILGAKKRLASVQYFTVFRNLFKNPFCAETVS